MRPRANHPPHGLLLVCALLTSSCQSPGTPNDPGFTAALIPASDLQLPDPSRSYEYQFVAANPDSLLRVLLRAGLAVDQAWLPLDNLCMDPRGPRFTVELARPSDRIARFDFVPGTGRLACATQLRHFLVTP